MRKALAALLFCLLTSSAGFPRTAHVPILATAISIDPADPAHRDIGRLRYLAGWHLTSRQADFGGYSALWVEGNQFLALADTGDYVRFRMTATGVISGSQFGVLPAFPADPAERDDRDSESMTLGPEGDIWVGFERRNAVMRYARDFARPISLSFPPAMANWPLNSGPESMARLKGGRFVIFAEGWKRRQHVPRGLLFPGDPTNPANVPIQFRYRPPRGYVPTDAQQLPDGRIVVLHRHFTMLDGFSAAVAIVDPEAIASDALVEGEFVAELRPPLNIDNMEGISVTREGGKTMLWMISDDNRMPVERTLLLKFQLVDNSGDGGDLNIKKPGR